MSYTVYKHTAPNGKVYIGITSNKLNVRWRNGDGYKQNKHFYSAILKCGWENMKHEVLFSGLTKETAAQKEMELIAQYKSNQREYGYNNSIGGEYGSLGSRHNLSLLTRKRMSDSRKGNKNYFFGKTHTKEVRKLLSKLKQGKTPPNKGKQCPNNIKTKIMMSNPYRKKVMCIETTKIYNSIHEAARTNNLDRKNLSRCCRKIKYYNTVGGYHWEFC